MRILAPTTTTMKLIGTGHQYHGSVFDDKLQVDGAVAYRYSEAGAWGANLPSKGFGWQLECIRMDLACTDDVLVLVDYQIGCNCRQNKQHQTTQGLCRKVFAFGSWLLAGQIRAFLLGAARASEPLIGFQIWIMGYVEDCWGMQPVAVFAASSLLNVQCERVFSRPQVG